jgi:nitrite reductase/ring-hydroxylating ferredoxin subunit
VTASLDLTRVVCRLEEIPDPGARAFTAGSGAWPLRGFVVRRGETAFAYLNRCPHRGHPLNWHPERFLTPDGGLILCASHGAVFEIESGACMGGPCRGIGLVPLELCVEDGYVILGEDPDELAARYA